MTAVPATLIYYVGSDNEWQWRMLDGDGEVIADSALPIDPTTRPRDAFYLPVAEAGTPTLADVLAAGNETGAVGSAVDIKGASAATATGATLSAHAAPDNTTGGYAQLFSGDFDPNNGPYGAGVTAAGGAAAQDGRVQVYTDGTNGASGEVLTSDGTYATWQSLFSTNAGAPGGTFVSVIRIDTTGKHAYIWNGSAYVLMADYV